MQLAADDWRVMLALGGMALGGTIAIWGGYALLVISAPSGEDVQGPLFYPAVWFVLASWFTTFGMLATDYQLTGLTPMPRTVLIAGGFLFFPFFFVVPGAALYFITRALLTRRGVTSPA